MLVLFTAACANVKKVQVIQDALSVKVLPDSAALAEKARLDSVLMVEGLVHNIAHTKINFNTMNLGSLFCAMANSLVFHTTRILLELLFTKKK